MDFNDLQSEDKLILCHLASYFDGMPFIFDETGVSLFRVGARNEFLGYKMGHPYGICLDEISADLNAFLLADP